MSDRYSGWPFVGKCGRSANSAEVIRQLKDWMTLTGIPAKLSSDGGPQFSSRVFREFCEDWGIEHVLSSPHYLQANGAAEAAVKTVKALLAKTTNKGATNSDDFRAGLTEYRNTPRASGMSPAQMVFGHPIRSNLVAHQRAFAKEWQPDTTAAESRLADN